jgi:fatty-acyl-CoA synthase
MNIPLTPLRFLRYAERQYPTRTAVVCKEKRYNYKEFAERTRRLAGALHQNGAQPGDRVAFLSTNCHRLLEGYYGVLEAGAVLLPLNIRLTASNLLTFSTTLVQQFYVSKSNSFRWWKRSARI